MVLVAMMTKIIRYDYRILHSMGSESIESHYAVSGWLTVEARPPTTGHTERQKVHLKTKGHLGWNFSGGTAHPSWHSKDRGMTSLSPMVWQDARAGDL